MEDREIRNKRIIWFSLLLIIVLFIIIIFLAYMKTKKDSSTKNINYYFLLEFNTKWHYDGNNWNTLSKTNTNGYEWEKFYIYDNNKYLGNYNLQYTKNWYIFDDDSNSIKYTGPLFAYRGFDKINFYNDVEDFNDDDLLKLKEILLTFDIKQYNILTYAKKINLESNGENITIYIANNTISNESEDKIFSIVYLKQKDKIHILKKVYGPKSEENLIPNYYFSKIFKINNEEKYKIGIRKSYYGNGDDCIMLYDVDNKNNERLIDCANLYSNENKLDEKETKFNYYFIILFSLIGVLLIFAVFATFIFIKNKKENAL